MKKIFVLLGVFVILALVGCGGDNKASKEHFMEVTEQEVLSEILYQMASFTGVRYL